MHGFRFERGDLFLAFQLSVLLLEPMNAFVLRLPFLVQRFDLSEKFRPAENPKLRFVSSRHEFSPFFLFVSRFLGQLFQLRSHLARLSFEFVDFRLQILRFFLQNFLLNFQLVVFLLFLFQLADGLFFAQQILLQFLFARSKFLFEFFSSLLVRLILLRQLLKMIRRFFQLDFDRPALFLTLEQIFVRLFRRFAFVLQLVFEI